MVGRTPSYHLCRRTPAGHGRCGYSQSLSNRSAPRGQGDGQVGSPLHKLHFSRAARVTGLTATLLLIFLLLPTDAEAAACSASGGDPQYVTCNFGLELWEEGKKSESIFQRWDLTCESTRGGPTWCTLERT